MIAKLHRVRSFSEWGAAHLGGQACDTSSPTAWTETRNLARDRPITAMKIMEAIICCQPHLKEEAGIPNTGSKLNAPAQVLTLAWHPKESAALTQEEMRRAADGALAALQAEAFQALIVCPKSDKAHPYLHVLINRVSPIDGRILVSFNEHRALSSWAKSYEADRGALLCGARGQ